MTRRGITLLELLVSVSIIAVLLALAAPALFSTRGAAREKQCLATLRGVGQATHVWANDHRGAFPHLGTPGQLYNVWTDPESGTIHGWFDNSWSWTISMRGYLDARQRVCPWHPSLDSPNMSEEHHTGSNYALSSALYTNWAMWKETNPITTMDQLRPVRVAEVAHPSRKAMFVEFIPFHLAGFDQEAYTAVSLVGAWGRLRHGVNTALVDGSARSPRMNTLESGPRPPDPFLLDPKDEGDFMPFPLITTRDGFLGADFK